MLDVALQKSFKERFATIRTLNKEALAASGQSLQLSIRNAGENAFFEYLGHTYCIKEKNRYEETSDDFKTKKDYFIYELTCLCLETGKTVHFEWEFDDELEISMTTERFSFRNLKDDQGEAIDGDDLDQIAEDKDAIVINGETFWYEDDWASIFVRSAKEEKVYMYEFQNEGGTKFLSIEEWQGSGKDEYQIYTSIPINPDSISIISKGEG
ncbi:MAG: DUF4178 domain-containing protein [Desulfobacula sp.]|nr:DUF4178 domain-containing protein [Desulfobacula sp.]